MPGGADFLILGLIFFGSVIGLVIELVFTLLLLLRLHAIAKRARTTAAASEPGTPSATPPPVGKRLPIIAIVVAIFLLLTSLGGLGLTGSITGAMDRASIWVFAGWTALLLLSITNIFWASIVLRSTSWSPRGLILARVLPLVATIIIPALLPVPSLLKVAKVSHDNQHAHRFVEKTLMGHFLGVNDIAFTTNGRHIVSVSKQDEHPLPAFWRLTSGERTFPSYAEAHKRKAAASLCYVNGGIVWVSTRPRFTHGALLYRPSDSPKPPRHLPVRHAAALGCNPGGKRIVVGSELYQGTVTVFAFPEGKVVASWHVQSNPHHVAISHDGRFVAYDFARQAGVHVHRVADGKVVRKIPSNSRGRSHSAIALSPTGAFVAVAESRRLRVWALGGKDDDAPVFDHAAKASRGHLDVLFTPRSKELVAVGLDDHVLARFSTTTWKPVGTLDTWPEATDKKCTSPRCLAIVSDADATTSDAKPATTSDAKAGQALICCPGYVALVDLATGHASRRFSSVGDTIEHLTFSAAHKRLAVGGRDLPLTQFDVTTGEHIRVNLSAGMAGHAWSLAISPATGFVAVGMNSGRIALRKGPGIAAQALLFPPPGSISGDMVALAFDATGQHLLSAERDGLLILHTLTPKGDKKPARPAMVNLKKKIVALGSLAASRFVSLTKDGELQRWRVNGDALAKDGHAASGCKKARALATRPGAHHLAIGCQDGTIRLLAPDTLTPGSRVLAHPGGVTALALAPKNAQLLSGGDDGRVRIWSLPNLQGGKVIFSPVKKRSGKVSILRNITRIVFSRAGDRFAVGTARNHRNIHIFRTAALKK